MVDQKPDPKAIALIDGLRGAQGALAVRALRALARSGHPTDDAALAAAALTLAWGPLMRKRISTMTAELLPWWLQAVRRPDRRLGRRRRSTPPTRFCGLTNDEIIRAALADRHRLRGPVRRRSPTPPASSPSRPCSACCCRTGPGTISAQGAKGAVSADGPETPERVQLNKAMIGFLTHAGYAHGGNGYEGIAFLIDQFKDAELADPGDPDARHRSRRPGGELRRRIRELQDRQEVGRQPRHPEDPRRQPPGVQGQAGQQRSARGLRARSVRPSAANTTSSTSSTTRWCRRCSTPACRATSTASTSTR